MRAIPHPLSLPLHVCHCLPGCISSESSGIRAWPYWCMMCQSLAILQPLQQDFHSIVYTAKPQSVLFTLNIYKKKITKDLCSQF